MTITKTISHQSTRSNRSSHSHAAAASRTQSHSSSLNHARHQPKTETPAWLHGHLHHLTPEQERALDEFKAVCVEQKLYTPATAAEERPSHDDATLLRFLRARKFDVKGALDQFKATEEWRKENQIDALYENFDVESYEGARRVYPQWTGHRDRRGIPVYVFVIKHLNSKNMATYMSNTSSSTTSPTHTSSKVPSRLLRLFALYENMTRFVLPLCSALKKGRSNPETPIVSTTNIVDISGVGLKQFWNLKGHMQDASVLATAHYPETLDRIFIIGAPAFFPTVWGWIKRWFDPVTTSKIFILSSSEVKSTLESFMDPSAFPKQYGGDLDWQWGDLPDLDDAAREVAGAMFRPTAEDAAKAEYVKGPVVFGDDYIHAMGTAAGKERREQIPVTLPPPEAAVAEKETENANGSITDGVAAMTVNDEKAAAGINSVAPEPQAAEAVKA